MSRHRQVALPSRRSQAWHCQLGWGVVLRKQPFAADRGSGFGVCWTLRYWQVRSSAQGLFFEPGLLPFPFNAAY